MVKELAVEMGTYIKEHNRENNQKDSHAKMVVVVGNIISFVIFVNVVVSSCCNWDSLYCSHT